ncbi:MAG: hypothetical protein H6633_30645 [Anaerolineales bacterium]|nr:hypothetical protein [Anaerolineales bacterium]
MILVRIVIQAKWGKAQDVVEGSRQAVEIIRRITGSAARIRILTDLSGPFNTVVQEVELESMADWERYRTMIFTDPEFQQQQASTAAFHESGRLELYTIEGDF